MTAWEGPEESIGAVLDHQVWTKEVWLAAIEGADLPERGGTDAAALIARHEAVAGRWLAMVRDIDRRGAWDDRIVDALCDPPESFVLGSVIAHVLTFAAHRRLLVRADAAGGRARRRPRRPDRLAARARRGGPDRMSTPPRCSLRSHRGEDPA